MPTYTCENCEYTTNKKCNYDRHVRTNHSVKDESMYEKCAYCGGKFSTKGSLKRHVEMYCVKYGQFCTAELANARCQQSVTSRPKVDTDVPNIDIEIPKVDIELPNVDTDAFNATQTRFPCSTCYKVYETKSGLSRHVCEGISHPNQCPKCKKVLSSASTKSRHVRNCTAVTNQVPATSSTTVTNIQSQTNIQGNNTNINTQNNIQNIQQNIQLQTINVRPFGQEDVAHITNSFKDARLKEYNGRGIFNFIKDVHFNPMLPQNHNVRKFDKNYCNVYDDGEWIIKSLRSVMIELVQMYQYKLKQRVLDPECKYSLGEGDWALIYDNFSKFDKNKNPSDYYKLIRDVTALLEHLEKRYTNTMAALTHA